MIINNLVFSSFSRVHSYTLHVFTQLNVRQEGLRKYNFTASLGFGNPDIKGNIVQSLKIVE